MFSLFFSYNSSFIGNDWLGSLSQCTCTGTRHIATLVTRSFIHNAGDAIYSLIIMVEFLIKGTSMQKKILFLWLVMSSLSPPIVVVV